MSKAIGNNSQLFKHHADNSISRQLSTNYIMIRYRMINSVFFTNTLLAQTTPSNQGNKYAQQYVSDK